jgi:hypothetical protein
MKKSKFDRIDSWFSKYQFPSQISQYFSLDLKSSFRSNLRTYMGLFCSYTCITVQCSEILNTVKLGYNELGYKEHSVITNKFLGKIGHLSTQMNPVITKPGNNEQK